MVTNVTTKSHSMEFISLFSSSIFVFLLLRLTFSIYINGLFPASTTTKKKKRISAESKRQYIKSWKFRRQQKKVVSTTRTKSNRAIDKLHHTDIVFSLLLFSLFFSLTVLDEMCWADAQRKKARWKKICAQIQKPKIRIASISARRTRSSSSRVCMSIYYVIK